MKKLYLFGFLVALLALGSCANDGLDAHDNNPSTTTEATVAEKLAPNVGGAHEPNQVYVSLGTKKMTDVRRDTWDFGFYCGFSPFRVILNDAILMSAKKLNTTDISLPQEIDNSMIIVHGGDVPATRGIVDDPSGIITGAGGGVGTAIEEIEIDPSKNHVYLVNLGSKVGTKDAKKGEVEPYGEDRGWKKIKIFRNGFGYKIQYADLKSTTYEERTIDKLSSDYNFNFFSMETGATLPVEPPKAEWDLCFTALTNYTPDVYGRLVVYPMVDVVVTNMKARVMAYQVLIAKEGSYEDFTIKNITDMSRFIPSATDQRIIGTSWRDVVINKHVKKDRFYVVRVEDPKDPKRNVYYKLRFTALENEAGERGYPAFEYKLLGEKLPENFL